MMKYHTTAHKNKTPVGEMDAFTAILLFIYLFIYFDCYESIQLLILN